MATEPRVRESLRMLWLEKEKRPKLDKFVRALDGIQKLPPDDPNSYFTIAGYHGEPFAVPEHENIEWGGYCFHSGVLFPTWHRAYCLRFENALRSIPGCQDVTLPYWDELAEEGVKTPVPEVLTLTDYKFLDGTKIPNPLRSYALQKRLVGKSKTDDRYTKHEGYNTVRFPLSGLVGTEEDRNHTKFWNEKFSTPDDPLNGNIKNWLLGNGNRFKEFPNTRNTDTTSIVSRIRKCLDTNDWTYFSNNYSATQYNDALGPERKKEWVVSIESPHNAMHLALGGFFQLPPDMDPDNEGYNANPEDFQHAQGDMGCNETAAFDPVFFLHHCFIDYMMWAWQKKHGKTQRGSLEIDYKYKKGTFMAKGNAALPAGTTMKMDSPLAPFKKPNSDKYYTSDDLTDIADLGYSYGIGSLEILRLTPDLTGEIKSSATAFEVTESESKPEPEIVALKETATVPINKFSGSFVIRTYATTADGKRIEIGREAILSRYNPKVCGSCQNTSEATSIVPITKAMAQAVGTVDPETKKGRIDYTVEIHHLGGYKPWPPEQGDVPAGFQANDQFIEYDAS